MTFINLTPHAIEVYAEDNFVNLEQLNATTWVADAVQGKAIVSLPSQGVARIVVSTKDYPAMDGVPMVKTTYGEATGIPAALPGDVAGLVVSLPMQSMMKEADHVYAHLAVAPFKVVRLRANTSTVLGCMGFTY